MIAARERWGVDVGYDEKQWSMENEEELTQAILNLQGAHQTTFHLIEGDKWWSVDVDSGRFAVGFQLAEAQNYNLIGDYTSKGSPPFIIGGQQVDYPSRYIVDLEKVLETATEFYRTRSLDLDSTRWEKWQGGI